MADQFKKRGRRVIASSHPLPSYTLVPTIFAHEVFEEAVALSMSVEAFKRNRKVRWDPAKEVIVSCFLAKKPLVPGSVAVEKAFPDQEAAP